MIIRAIRELLAIIVALSVLTFIAVVGPVVEAAIAPVMRYPAIIDKVERASEFETRIWGSTERLRNCDFIELEWFIGVRGGRAAAVRVQFEEPPVIREKGALSFGPWRVSVPMEQINGTYADAIHRCKYFGIIPAPWRIRSPFYG